VQRTKTPAEVYEEFFVPGFFAPCAAELLDLLAARTGERVLDVGCGSGIVARTVAPLVGASGGVAAVDIRPGMIAVAASLPAPDGAAIEWREGDALALDYAPASFDLVLCQQGLQYFPDPTKALGEMRRVLRAGGRVGIAVWQGLDRHDFLRALTESEARHLSVVGLTYEDVAAPFLLGDPGWLRDALADAGFEDVRVEQRSFDAGFPTPQTFVENLEFAYSAVIPEFSEDPAAFAAFVKAVETDLADVLASYVDDDEVVFPMHVNLGTAGVPREA
jgi:SAM-dependent methyltransferase